MSVDVVIVGGGPTGVMLACELRLAGARPVVLERLPEPTGLSKALGLGGRAVEILDHRGLLERFRAEQGALDMSIFRHFGGIPLDLRGLDDDRGSAPRRFLAIHQARIEALLEERARELRVEIRRGHELTGLEQDGEGATVVARGPEGETRLRARFVVGCDGGRSAVRKLAGIGFPGLPPSRLLRLADVVLPEDATEQGHLVLSGGRRVRFGLGGIAIVPLGAGVFRVVTSEPYPPDFDRGAPMTLDELQASVRQALGEDLPVREVRWLSRFTDASRQADRYRAGRVLLAGDAAHIHLPAGGPGLNTGLQDAVNLGWKLAAEIHGSAPPGLLDTYHAERHPEGKRVIMHTRAQGALMARDERVAALRELLGELLKHEQSLRYVVDMLDAVDVRYDMRGEPGESHPLLGRWAPELRLITREGETRVAELMRRARGVLLDLTGGAALGDVAAPWDDRVDTVVARSAGPTRPAEAMLIRPDGYVAWVAGAGEPDGGDHRRLRRALTTWFGAPRGG
ncbi:FAD-dependent monooxygenase [Sorangium sp. So ce136]|uniref:FAD-dependent monooxygenase n=1 Tax=Sorangium sp. So ce136 TaxID=3133284 RepID=UPI003F060BD3